MKKFFIYLILFIEIFPSLVNASSNSAAKIRNMYYDSLESAIANANRGDIITLTSNVELDDTLLINKTINLNLNGRSISAPAKVFQVQGGTLNIDGEGIIKETKPNYGAIMIKGSSNPNDKDYSVVNVGANVALEGWSGIFITHDSAKSYGVDVNFAGKIKAVNDTEGANGIGIYVNGNIKDQTNAPVVNILDGAEIISSGNGLYIAGYSTFNIGTAYIEGIQSGIGIKAGTLNIAGATIVCNGKDNTPTEGYNNGMNASGTAIQIESNSGYAGNMNINIKDGNFKSKESNVIYEYIGKGNNSLVNSFNISGGNFTSGSAKEVFALSNSFKEKHNNFITGGKYSSNPNFYLLPGYTTTIENDLYNVVKSTMLEVENKNNSSNNNFSWGTIIILIGVLILIILTYLNRRKIINLLKK